jgi:hypothetical protein
LIVTSRDDSAGVLNSRIFPPINGRAGDLFLAASRRFLLIGGFLRHWHTGPPTLQFRPLRRLFFSRRGARG